MKAATDLYDVSVLDTALLQRKLFDKVSRGPGRPLVCGWTASPSFHNVQTNYSSNKVSAQHSTPFAIDLRVGLCVL